MKTSIAAPVNQPAQKSTKGLGVIVKNWAAATALGWFLALGLASLPYFSWVDPSMDSSWSEFGPQFRQSGMSLTWLFAVMGGLSSLPQMWVLRKWTNRSILWVIFTMLGAAAGGVINGYFFPDHSFWAAYGFSTLLPVSMAHFFALWLLFPGSAIGWGMGVLFARPVIFAVLFMCAWPLLLGFLAAGVVVSGYFLPGAVFFALGMGLPFGLFSGIFVERIVLSYWTKTARLPDPA